MKHIQIRSLAAVIVALTVIGCASTTPTSIKDRTLETVQRSKKSAQEVTNCIVPKWEEISLIGGSPMVNFRPTDNGFRVTMHIDNRLAYMAEITVDAY